MYSQKKILSKLIYVSASLVLVFSFLIVALEKTNIIDLYKKPVPDEVRPTNDVDYSPAKPEDNTQINKSKESEKSVSNNEVNLSEPISITLSAARQDSPGGPLVVLVLVHNSVSGECITTVSNSIIEKVYRKNIESAGNYFNCQPLSIPMSELSAGTWQVNVVVTEGDRKGEAEQSVEVKN